jgi:glycosyltransferase involved in cell wall biosynthesis
VWSTSWQKDIFVEPYGLQKQRYEIIENYYAERYEYVPFQNKNFVGGTRVLKWKNLTILNKVFQDTDVLVSGAKLDLERVPHAEFLEKIKQSYAVIIPSLGDISPNTILDAIRCQKPFIVTRETGLYDRIAPIALFVDPKNPDDIKEKVLWLSDEENYKNQCAKIKAYTHTHSWEEIAKEYEEAYLKIK